MLNGNGKILIGDVAFITRVELDRCKEKYNQYWDIEEIYLVAEEIIQHLNEEYFCDYIKISHCAGVLTISNK